jgi:hypothetical protein
MLCGCLSPTLRRGQWTPEAPAQFKFEDTNLRFQFSFSNKRFDWQFHNKRGQSLVLEPEEMQLTIEGDPTPFTLWGIPDPDPRTVPSLRVNPKGFLSIGYPILYNEKLVPFPTLRGQQVIFSFTAHWGDVAVPYILRFPPPAPADVPEPQ